MTIQEKLRSIKQFSGLTQEQMAKQLDVSFVTLNSWINGRSIPRLKKQKKIEELYSKYSGTKIVPETLLEAKKELLKKRSHQQKNVLAFILNNQDIFDNFVLSLTYNTNKIEGSTLTEDETADIIFNNASLPNKSLTEHLEAKNHQTAFVALFNWLKNKKPIGEELLLKLHLILMNGIRSDAGSYRNYGVRIMGTNVPTANYLKVPFLMKKLAEDLRRKTSDPIKKASEIHSRLEQIHPFSDGNGRIGRLLIHAMLLQNNYPPALILQENKRIYMRYLNKAQMTDDQSLLEDFLCDAVLLGFKMLERKK
jgi:Fic family protein